MGANEDQSIDSKKDETYVYPKSLDRYKITGVRDLTVGNRG